MQAAGSGRISGWCVITEMREQRRDVSSGRRSSEQRRARISAGYASGGGIGQEII
jgi:hypothetical protein